MPEPYRVLVTGSRDWPWPQQVADALDEVLNEVPLEDTLIVMHGAATQGADFDAHAWSLRHAKSGRVIEDPRRADWIRHKQAAGMIRNEQMVSAGPDVVLAFIAECANPTCDGPRPHGSHGASHCAGLAEKAGIPVRRWTA